VGGDRPCRALRAFTLIDVLVSIAVIAILISLLLPSLAKVNETARRVVCQSNIRQVGLGVVMYADDWNGFLPPSVFMDVAGSQPGPRQAPAPQNMVAVRVTENPNLWDGLGVLFQHGYVSAPKVFYCPSHIGENSYPRYAQLFDDSDGEIICNYHFRGAGPVRPARPGEPSRVTTKLYLIDPTHSSLIADGMQVRSDFNHKVGVNFFRADLTVHWFDDSGRQISNSLPEDKDEANANIVNSAWNAFDQSTQNN